jgi:hypothetical protein
VRGLLLCLGGLPGAEEGARGRGSEIGGGNYKGTPLIWGSLLLYSVSKDLRTTIIIYFTSLGTTLRSPPP